MPLSWGEAEAPVWQILRPGWQMSTSVGVWVVIRAVQPGTKSLPMFWGLGTGKRSHGAEMRSTLRAGLPCSGVLLWVGPECDWSPAKLINQLFRRCNTAVVGKSFFCLLRLSPKQEQTSLLES